MNIFVGAFFAFVKFSIKDQKKRSFHQKLNRYRIVVGYFAVVMDKLLNTVKNHLPLKLMR